MSWWFWLEKERKSIEHHTCSKSTYSPCNCWTVYVHIFKQFLTSSLQLRVNFSSKDNPCCNTKCRLKNGCVWAETSGEISETGIGDSLVIWKTDCIYLAPKRDKLFMKPSEGASAYVPLASSYRGSIGARTTLARDFPLLRIKRPQQSIWAIFQRLVVQESKTAFTKTKTYRVLHFISQCFCQSNHKGNNQMQVPCKTGLSHAWQMKTNEDILSNIRSWNCW